MQWNRIMFTGYIHAVRDIRFLRCMVVDSLDLLPGFNIFFDNPWLFVEGKQNVCNHVNLQQGI